MQIILSKKQARQYGYAQNKINPTLPIDTWIGRITNIASLVPSECLLLINQNTHFSVIVQGPNFKDGYELAESIKDAMKSFMLGVGIPEVKIDAYLEDTELFLIGPPTATNISREINTLNDSLLEIRTTAALQNKDTIDESLIKSLAQRLNNKSKYYGQNNIPIQLMKDAL